MTDTTAKAGPQDRRISKVAAELKIALAALQRAHALVHEIEDTEEWTKVDLTASQREALRASLPVATEARDYAETVGRLIS